MNAQILYATHHIAYADLTLTELEELAATYDGPIPTQAIADKFWTTSDPALLSRREELIRGRLFERAQHELRQAQIAAYQTLVECSRLIRKLQVNIDMQLTPDFAPAIAQTELAYYIGWADSLLFQVEDCYISFIAKLKEFERQYGPNAIKRPGRYIESEPIPEVIFDKEEALNFNRSIASVPLRVAE